MIENLIYGVIQDTHMSILRNKDKIDGWNDLLNNIDVLVDGKFQLDKKKEGLKYRGSSNQRIIDVKKSLEVGEVIILPY